VEKEKPIKTVGFNEGVPPKKRKARSEARHAYGKERKKRFIQQYGESSSAEGGACGREVRGKIDTGPFGGQYPAGGREGTRYTSTTEMPSG